METDQLTDFTYDEYMGRLTTYVLNEHQEDSPAPRKPAAAPQSWFAKREPPRPRRDPATVRCFKCKEYGHYQADCDAVIADDEDAFAAPTITPAELKILRRLLAAERGAGATAGKRGVRACLLLPEWLPLLSPKTTYSSARRIPTKRLSRQQHQHPAAAVCRSGSVLEKKGKVHKTVD